MRYGPAASAAGRPRQSSLVEESFARSKTNRSPHVVARGAFCTFTGDVTTIDAESTATEAAVTRHASLVGSGTGARDPLHAVASSMVSATSTNDRSTPC